MSFVHILNNIGIKQQKVFYLGFIHALNNIDIKHNMMSGDLYMY